MSLEVAINTALHGPSEKKQLKVLGHHFNVKPAALTRAGDLRIADGQISHHLRFRPDDQVYYHIEKRGDLVTKLDMKITRGGITSILAPLAPLAGLVGIPLTSEMVEKAGQQLGLLAEGDWVPAVQAIVLGIAARL